MNVRRWSRSRGGQLSTNFNAREFNCKCGVCTGQFVDQDLIDKLEEVREAIGGPLTVTSGYRCALYQQLLRRQGMETSVGMSTHEKGMAADIVADDMAALEKAVDGVFASYGVAKSFIHVDLRPGPTPTTKRVWRYKS